MERELLQLRPLKNQLEQYSQSTQKQIEESVRLDYDRGRLQTQVQTVSNERDLAKQEVAELQVKYTTLLQQNERIKEQLRLLESESFEIQARVRRGVEVERENENISRTVEAQRDRDL